VGRRARPVIITDEEQNLKATHTGYESLGINHFREWIVNEKELQIADEIKGKKAEATAYIHLHPEVKPIKIEECVYKLKNLTLVLDNPISVTIESYLFCLGFNKTQQAQRFVISFNKSLKTTLKT
ncbi:MAG TPA: hypothetical protein DD671_15095, partial [Balneolaceae bacterium]|nr:hypothetical protein [Balneolaceae bacterium]